MYINRPDELSDIYTMLSVLMNLESCAEEILDDVIYDVSVEDLCYGLEAANKIPDAGKLLKIIEDRCPWGTFYAVTEALGIDEDMDYPIAQYLAATYLSSTESTRKIVFNAVISFCGVEIQNPTPDEILNQKNWNQLYFPITPEQIKVCEEWVCPDY